MSKWTPGPWAWVDGDGGDVMMSLSAPEDDNIVIDSAPYEGMWFCRRGTTKTNANMRLIAAAPEMAEALAEAQLHIPIMHKKLHAKIGALLARIEGDA